MSKLGRGEGGNYDPTGSWRNDPLTKGDMYDSLSKALEDVKKSRKAFDGVLHFPGLKRIRDLVDMGFKSAVDALTVAAKSISGED